MKRKLYTFLVCLAGCLVSSSCSDWFDVSPSTDVPAEELFETEQGFQSALAGIYIGMTDTQAYGDNLSFGMLDQLAQLYDVLPDGAGSTDDIYNYETTTNMGYNTKGRLAGTWTQAYKMIANANNLLKWLDLNGERVILSPETRDMMRGEALAIRAYIHFDLLRGWGPMNYQGSEEAKTAKTIPYRTVADNSKQPLLQAQTVLGKIVDDLDAAKQLLSFESGISLSDYGSKDRRFRFNYHAINATLARVYCYMGEKEKAIECAQDVIDHCGLELQESNSEDPVLSNEMICGLYMYKMQETLSSRWADGDKLTSQYYSNGDTFTKIFDNLSSMTSESEDMRAKSSAFIRYTSENKVQSRKYIKNDNGAIPLIRLPEMYYIICAMTSPDDDACSDAINAVRRKRGYSSDTDEHITTASERELALSKEYRKEFYAEGQYFFFLKQHPSVPMEHYDNRTLNSTQFIFPLPDAEKEYGWTPEEDNGQTDQQE